MRTINENKGCIKRIYSFGNTNFTYREEVPDYKSSFYTFGIQRQIEFAGYSHEKGSLLVKELIKKYLY